MSNDLISRKEATETLKNVFDKYGVSWGEKYGGFAKAIPNAIKDLPTAYNVESVVEQLEECSVNYCKEYCYAEDENVLYLPDAIEIVKGGAE